MRISLYFIVITAFMLFNACKKNNKTSDPAPIQDTLITPEPEPEPVKLLTKSTLTTAYRGQKNEYFYTYNQQKQLDSIILKTSDNEISSIKCFFYDDNGNLIKTESTTVDDYKIIREFSYENNLPISGSSRSYDKGILQYESLYKYFVKEGRITENETISGGGISRNRYKYTYKDDNIIFYNNDNLAPPSGVTEFIYGDKKSPYYNSRMKYCFDPNQDAISFSRNELLVQKRASWDGKSTFDFIYEYTFDEEGYPLKAIVKNKLENGTITDSAVETYEYELL